MSSTKPRPNGAPPTPAELPLLEDRAAFLRATITHLRAQPQRFEVAEQRRQVYLEALGMLVQTFGEPRWDGVWDHHADRVVHLERDWRLADAPDVEVAIGALCLYGFGRDRRAHKSRNAGYWVWLEAAREAVATYAAHHPELEQAAA